MAHPCGVAWATTTHPFLRLVLSRPEEGIRALPTWLLATLEPAFLSTDCDGHWLHTCTALHDDPYTHPQSAGAQWHSHFRNRAARLREVRQLYQGHTAGGRARFRCQVCLRSALPQAPPSPPVPPSSSDLYNGLQHTPAWPQQGLQEFMSQWGPRHTELNYPNTRSAKKLKVGAKKGVRGWAAAEPARRVGTAPPENGQSPGSHLPASAWDSENLLAGGAHSGAGKTASSLPRREGRFCLLLRLPSEAEQICGGRRQSPASGATPRLPNRRGRGGVGLQTSAAQRRIWDPEPAPQGTERPAHGTSPQHPGSVLGASSSHPRRSCEYHPHFLDDETASDRLCDLQYNRTGSSSRHLV